MLKCRQARIVIFCSLQIESRKPETQTRLTAAAACQDARSFSLGMCAPSNNQSNSQNARVREINAKF